MFSGTRPTHINSEYPHTEALAYPSSFPPFFQPLEFPVASGAFPVSIGANSYGDPTIAYGGINYPIYRTVPGPGNDSYQTYVGYYPPAGYKPLVDHQGSADYRRISGENQDIISHGLPPIPFMPALQPSTNRQTAANFTSQNAFRYGSQLKPPQDIDWDDPDAVVAHMNKLKGAWRACVGMKRRGAGNRRSRRTEQYPNNSIQGSAGQDGPGELDAEDHLDDDEEALLGNRLRVEQQDRSSQGNTPILPVAFSQFHDIILNEELSSGIELVKHLHKMDLLKSSSLQAKSPTENRLGSKSTRGSKSKPQSPTKNKLDRKLARGSKAEPQSPTRGPTSKTVKPASSNSLSPKKPPTAASRTGSTSPSKGLTCLRPPRPIAKSSKPTTQPVPFSFSGEPVARKLKFSPTKQRQTCRA